MPSRLPQTTQLPLPPRLRTEICDRFMKRSSSHSTQSSETKNSRYNTGDFRSMRQVQMRETVMRQHAKWPLSRDLEGEEDGSRLARYHRSGHTRSRLAGRVRSLIRFGHRKTSNLRRASSFVLLTDAPLPHAGSSASHHLGFYLMTRIRIPDISRRSEVQSLRANNHSIFGCKTHLDALERRARLSRKMQRIP